MVAVVALLLVALIVAGVALVVIGMFWRLIVAGAVLAFCVAVFAMPTPTPTAQEKLEQSFKKDFMEDCVHYGDTKQNCEAIWNDRKTEL